MTDARIAAFGQEWNPVATIVLAALLDMPQATGAASPNLFAASVNPSVLKANRDVLRWHCALIV